MKDHEHVSVINYDTNIHLFTRHGIHLNKIGKEAITKYITATCVKFGSSLFVLDGIRKL
jgi:hypothetical protein